MSKLATLSEICDELSDGLHKAPIFNSQGEYLFVNANNLQNGYIIDSGDGRKADFSEYSKYKIELNYNTILYSIDGTIGNIAKYRGEKCILGKGACYLKIKDSVYSDYIYYLLQNSHFKNYLKTMATGSTIHHISLQTMRNYTFVLPEYEKQKKIADVLHVIDEKIENNSRSNLELEAMAKTIYDYWFLQFEFPNEEGKPYKSSGGKMVWNKELQREIPEGWEVGNLYDIADFVNGLACQKYRPISEDKLPVIKISEMHDGITKNTEWVRADIPQKNIIDNGDILFSWSATLETMIWCGGKAGLNQHIFKVITKKYPANYVYMQLSAYIVNFVKMAEARKTTMGHITTNHIKQSLIVLPVKSITEKYDTYVKSSLSKIIENNIENRELIAFREFLLPLLMNGQIGFKE